MTPFLAQKPRTDRAFERLYRKHAGDVYRYALVVLRNESDAEDVTQTTFLNAYRAYERGERPRSPQNWLIAIAHNVCRQRFRQSQRRPNEVELNEELAEAGVEEDPVSAEDIRRALGHLAFNQRAALVMRELEGRSYQEIAGILDLSVSAVETLIFRARRALREQLEDGLTCHEAEYAISRQLDGRLPRKERGTLRAHLRECEECARFARSQRAQRGALKSLAAIPLPQSLASLFGGGGGATVGGGIAIKAAAVGATAMFATGVGYEGVKHKVWRAPTKSAAAATQRQAPAEITAVALASPTPQAATDLKPYRSAPTTPRPERSDARAAVAKPKARPEHEAKPTEHREFSPLPPSRERTHDQKPTKPVRVDDQQRGKGQGKTKVDPPKASKPPKQPKEPKPEQPAASPRDRDESEQTDQAQKEGDHGNKKNG